MSRDALIVGINTYQHLRSLTAPANDAEAIAQLLSQDNHFLVRRLPEYLDPFEGNLPRIATSTEVNKTDLEDAILQLFLPQSERLPQTALFYFSGHGLRKERGITEGFLATSEANPPEDRWGISLKWLREILKQSQVPQQVIWLDCCLAAELFNYEEANPKGRDRCFIAAAREFEESWQDANSDYSVMTRVLVQGLSPQYQPDGIVDNYRLVALISQTLKEGKQRPVFFNVGEPILLVQSRQRQTPETTIRLQPEVCPYRGLAAFDATEADVRFFYGRTALTDELLETIWQQNFLAVLGPSGSGKSSVVRAGLIHAVQQGEKRDTKHWQVLPVIKPGEHPVVGLAEAFIPPGLTARQKERTRQGYIQSLQEEGATALIGLVSDYAPDPVLLVIDQFEEIFTLCQDDQERQQFLGYLMGTLDSSLSPSEANSPLLKIVITMRADFFGKCLEQDYNGLAERIKTNTVPITPLNRDELRDAIVQPAAQVGLQLEPELVQQMIMDVQDSPGSLPLLQYALTELWEQWHQIWQQNGTTTGNTLTLNGYTEIGGVRGALEKQANKVYNNLSEIEQTVARRLFLELTQLCEGTEDTRRRVLKRELINDQHPEGLLDQVIHKLSDTRLIVTDERTDGTRSEVVVDVAHEALIRHWTQLRQWVNADRDTLRTERKLKAAAQEWQEKGHQVPYLWLGARLAEANEIYEQCLKLGRLNILTQAFVEACRAEQLKQDQEKEKQIRSLNQALTESRVQEQSAKILYLLSIQQSVQQNQVGLSLAIKLVGENLRNPKIRVLTAVQNSLLQAMTKSHVPTNIQGHKCTVTSVAFSPDKHTFASSSDDRNVILWDIEGNQINQLPQKGLSAVLTVAFSPDGQSIVGGNYDKTLWLWNIKSNLIQSFHLDYEDAITSVAFSPNGQIIISGSQDSTVQLCDLDGNFLGEVKRHKGEVTSVVFSPDGQIIASGSHDRTIQLFDLEGRPIGKSFEGHEREVTSLAFSPDGQMIVSGSLDGTVRLWKLLGNPINFPSIGHESGVTSVAFSPDGQTIASGGKDGYVRFWDLAGNSIDQPLSGYAGECTSVAFSLDGETVVSGIQGGILQLWDIKNVQIGQPFIGHEGKIMSVAVSPDGLNIISSDEYETILWDIEGNRIGESFRIYGEEFASVAFSLDSQNIISSSQDGIIRIWDFNGTLIKQSLNKHEREVTSVAFSSESKIIVSGKLLCI